MITRSVFQKGLAAVGLAALAALTTLPQQASAATDGLPDGSWRQSCERGYVSGGKLYARCRHEGGYYQDTSVQTASCRAFGNRNGTLFCESPDASVGGHRHLEWLIPRILPQRRIRQARQVAGDVSQGQRNLQAQQPACARLSVVPGRQSKWQPVLRVRRQWRQCQSLGRLVWRVLP